MRLLRYVPRGENQPRFGFLVSKDHVVDMGLAARLYRLALPADQPLGRLDTMEEFLADFDRNLAGASAVAEAATEDFEAGRLAPAFQQRRTDFHLDEVKLLPPIQPGKIICGLLNFRAHIEEGSKAFRGAPPSPRGFLKLPSCVVGPDQPIVYPGWIKHMDYEVELATVIGKRAKRVPRAASLQYVAGYTVLNDVSARDIQFEEQKSGSLLLGKNLDTFAPMGPWLVTRDEIPDPQNLGMELWVNAEQAPRQKSSTSRMIFSVAELVEHWSQMTLDPGDVITSGTPEGVAAFRDPPSDENYLKPGDLVRAKIERIGELRNRVAAEGEEKKRRLLL